MRGEYVRAEKSKRSAANAERRNSGVLPDRTPDRGGCDPDHCGDRHPEFHPLENDGQRSGGGTELAQHHHRRSGLLDDLRHRFFTFTDVAGRHFGRRRPEQRGLDRYRAGSRQPRADTRLPITS